MDFDLVPICDLTIDIERDSFPSRYARSKLDEIAVILDN